MTIRGIREAVIRYCESRYGRDRLAVRDCFEEMVRYLDLYSDDLDDVGVVRQGDKYCIGNISFDTIARRRLFDSLYPKFLDFLSEKAVLKRVYTAVVDIVCCLDVGVRYQPTSKKFTYVEDVSGGVEESLGDWMTGYAMPGLRELVESLGDDKCKTLSPSLYLCDWSIVSSDVWEER